jgi:superfamily II DNA/RNA helicase
MRDASGRQRKLIIFTEHRDTLNYLHGKIRGVLGSPEAVVTIHGGTKRDERRKVQELFRSDPDVRVLVATDAAGEGVNLQNANLMVNYDLPWNPNRLEQRFGRIHRIGQTEVCHLWNLVAKETREGDVFQRLLREAGSRARGPRGRVFDILGEVFEETSLKDLLIEAIRYGDRARGSRPAAARSRGRARHPAPRAIINRNALCEEVMDEKRLFAVKEEMEKAEARKLQPYFIRSFFSRRSSSSAASCVRARRALRDHPRPRRHPRARPPDHRPTAATRPGAARYERVCFEKQYVRLTDRSARRWPA